MNAIARLLSAEPRVIPKLPPSKLLRWVWIITFGSMLIGGNIYAQFAIAPGADRKFIASLQNCHVVFIFYAGIFAAMYLPTLRKWTPYERLQGVVLPFLVLSYFIQMTWELGFLLMHDQIALAKNEAWAYSWWSYMDGGDFRYMNATNAIVTMEMLGVTNSAVGIAALIWLYRSKFLDYRATLLILAVEAIQIPLTWFYYLSEVIGGYPNVNTHDPFDFYVTFWAINSPWLILPWMVVYWCTKTLQRQFAIAAKSRTGIS